MTAASRTVHTAATKATATPRAAGAPSIPYSLTGSLSVSTSPPIVPRSTMTFTGLTAVLGTPGTTSTTVSLLVNGVVQAQVVIPANTKWSKIEFGTLVPVQALQDYYQIQVQTAGTGAADLGGEIWVS